MGEQANEISRCALARQGVCTRHDRPSGISCGQHAFDTRPKHGRCRSGKNADRCSALDQRGCHCEHRVFWAYRRIRGESTLRHWSSQVSSAASTAAPAPKARSARSARFSPRPEERAARGRELRLIPYHAGFDAIHIRNMSEAESHSIGCAGLPLLRRIGGARVRPHQHGDRTCQHQADSKTTEDDRHDDFPRLSELSVRVSAFSWLHRSSHQAAPITPPRRHRRVARSTALGGATTSRQASLGAKLVTGQ